LTSRNWNRRLLWVTAPKSLVQFDYETAASIFLGAQGTSKATSWIGVHDPTSHADFGAAIHPGVGGGTHRRRATFDRY